MKLKALSFRNRFDILLEKRLSGVAEQKCTRLYGKSEVKSLELVLAMIICFLTTKEFLGKVRRQLYCKYV